MIKRGLPPSCGLACVDSKKLSKMIALYRIDLTVSLTHESTACDIPSVEWKLLDINTESGVVRPSNACGVIVMEGRS